MNIDFDNRDWQTVDISENTRLIGGGVVGSFNTVKVKILCPDEVVAASGRIERKTEKLPTAQGYHSLDGREITVSKKKRAVMVLRVEDCGLGSAKADAFIELIGFKLP